MSYIRRIENMKIFRSELGRTREDDDFHIKIMIKKYREGLIAVCYNDSCYSENVLPLNLVKYEYYGHNEPRFLGEHQRCDPFYFLTIDSNEHGEVDAFSLY